MSTEAQRTAMFETVLRERFGLDTEDCQESEDWWRFEVDGITFQGGVHSADVRVLALVCSMSASVDVGLVYQDLDQTEAIGLAGFIEADCYLYATARVSFADVSEARLEQMIRDCVEATQSPMGQSLKSKWRDW
jgi:hypothetical protein